MWRPVLYLFIWFFIAAGNKYELTVFDLDLTVPFLKYLLGAYFSMASEEGCGTFPDAALYLFLAGPMTGTDARSRCQGEGGRLMTFKTREEALAIRRVRGWDWKYEQATL